MSDLLKIIAQAGPMAVDAITQGIKSKQAANRVKDADNMIKHIMDNREEVTNPFGEVTNPYINMGVATQAAEMQMQQTDQALANTLDTLRATGTSAGGATALARAAAQSKQGVAASIEAQEAKNQQLIAAGEQRREQLIGTGENIRAQRQEARGDEQIAYQERLSNRNYAEQVNRQANMMSSLTGAINTVQGSLGPMFSEIDNLNFRNKTTDSGSTTNVNNDFGLDMTLGQTNLITPTMDNLMGQNTNPMYSGGLNTNLNLFQGGSFIPRTGIYKPGGNT